MADKRDEATRRETAAFWFAELQAADVTPAAWESFLEWEQDPANAAAYREIEATLGLLDQTSLSRTGRSRQDPKQGKDEGRGRRPALLAMAAAAIAILIAATALTINTPEPSPKPLTYATAIGAQQAVTLEDGSIVTLNTNTRLTVQYSKAERLIRLTQGEALFEVEHSDRPFFVDAGGTRTRALGTEFDIHAEEKSVSITLIEGSVRVTQSRSATDTNSPGAIPEDGQQEGIVLKPGDRLDLSPGKPPIRSTIDPARAGKWREGLLQFDNVTLANAIAELNRYSTTQLRIDDETLAAERISGTFPAGEAAAFASSLEFYLPVETRQTGEEIFLAYKVQ
jgi:transmembrane sensor